MKLFGRSPERWLLALKNLPIFLAASWRAFAIFEDPLTVLWAYISRTPPASGVVKLRSGQRIHLSADSADIVTVFLIFAREDYGKVAPGSIVLDIGANIGVFSLFAAFSGARAVHAFEPSASSHETLLKNIRENGLDTVIHAERRAVVGRPRVTVKFSRESDVMNEIMPDSSDASRCDLVPAIALSEIVSSLKTIDLLKSDCEGAEYDIFLNTGEEDLRKIAEIRMEYHEGPLPELLTRLRQLGFQVQQPMHPDTGGYLRLARTALPQGNAAGR